MKRFLLILLFIFSLSSLAFSKVRIGLLKNSVSVPFCFMLEKTDFVFLYFNTAQELIGAMKSGTVDAADVPAALAEKLTDSTHGRIFAGAITSYADSALLSFDSDVSAFSDLLGTQIYVVKNSFEESYFRFLLEKNEVPVKIGESGIEIVYSESSANIVSALASGAIRYGVVSEPFVSAAQVSTAKIKRSIDFQDEYSKIYGPEKKIPKSVLILRRQFVQASPELYVQLKEELNQSVQKIKLNPFKAAFLCKKNGISLFSYSAARSIYSSNYCFVPLENGLKLSF
ncbi:MAG: hypothetical protein IJL70_05890 [Treponema sp.]|nr:hypothetical protein [Treponema sp.]